MTTGSTPPSPTSSIASAGSLSSVISVPLSSMIKPPNHSLILMARRDPCASRINQIKRITILAAFIIGALVTTIQTTDCEGWLISGALIISLAATLLMKPHKENCYNFVQMALAIGLIWGGIYSGSILDDKPLLYSMASIGSVLSFVPLQPSQYPCCAAKRNQETVKYLLRPLNSIATSDN